MVVRNSEIEVDITNTSKLYWNKMLAKLNLSTKRGLNHRISLYGGLTDLVRFEESESERKTGKVRPEGFGPAREGSGEGRS